MTNPLALNRREFLRAGLGATCVLTPALASFPRPIGASIAQTRPTVSIVRIREGEIGRAVEEAIDLLGGIEAATRGRQRIMLKPNLVGDGSAYTTKPQVVEALARLMLRAGKEVCIGEGSASGAGIGDATRCEDLLQRLQLTVFERLGYADLAASLKLPLVNLHCGDLVTVPVPDGLYWREIALHRRLTEIDLLCSVAMMKTHTYATVTLGLKNLIGLYPGAVYGSYRWWVHDAALAGRSPGVAFEIIDMARVNRTGLTVIDASAAMEGNGPAHGSLVAMNLILAGTEPLATDMIAARVMGIAPEEVPTFVAAWRAGMVPTSLDEIEVRGESIVAVERPFVRADLIPPIPGGGGNDIDPAPTPDLRVEPDGRGVLQWKETVRQPAIDLDEQGRAGLVWGESAPSQPALLECRNALDPTGWERITPTEPGRHLFRVSDADAMFFRLRRR